MRHIHLFDRISADGYFGAPDGNLTFVVSPILIGSGQRAIRDVTTRLKLTLEEVKQYPTGNLKLRYAKA